MKKPFPHLLPYAVLVFGVGLAITPASAETIKDAIEGAVTSHPAVSGAQAARDASEQTVREQRSSYYPEISANATGGRVYGDNATSRGLSVTRGAGYSGFGEGSASLTQRIYDWGETSNKVDAAKAREHAAQSQIIGTRESVGLRAAQSYISLLRATKLKDASAQNLTTIEGYQQKIATQVKEGGSDEAELNRANDFLLLAQNAATEFEGQYQQALADFIEATGSKPASALSRPALPSGFPANVEQAIASARDQHPQIASAKEGVSAAAHDIDAESTMYLPKINGQLSYLKRDQADIIGGEAIDARAVMKMDWNYSTGGAQLARVARAEAGKVQAQAQLDETYRRIERDVRVAWSALDVVRQQQKTQADRKDATAKVIETYKTQYEGGGERKLIELMQAESQAFDASVAFDNADFGVLNATYTLMAAMGQLISGVKQAPAAQTAETPVRADSALVAPPVRAGALTEDVLLVPSNNFTAEAAVPAPAMPVPAPHKSLPPQEMPQAPAVISPRPETAPKRASLAPPAEDVLLVPSNNFAAQAAAAMPSLSDTPQKSAPPQEKLPAVAAVQTPVMAAPAPVRAMPPAEDVLLVPSIQTTSARQATSHDQAASR